jgi:hypothetical protein
MLVETSATPGSCLSCFSTASVHETPQTMPSTKNVTDSVEEATVAFGWLVVAAESQPIIPATENDRATISKVPVSGFINSSSDYFQRKRPL